MHALPRSGVLAIVLAAGVAASAGAGCSDDADPKVGACADYCELAMRNCTGNVAQYTDVDTCQATCRAMPLGDPASPTGNTIACRTFEAALAEDPSTMACTKAGPGGDGTCGDNCESFCTMAIDLCPGAYADHASCLTTCNGYDKTEVYDASDIAGDTFACRLYHLTAASTNPDVHCAHIGPVSPVCL
ncbi:MAG TPA: hypothetical protein VHE35_27085 [Kofleriaceae bacterium]|nr:hypothetical protein [Kofleriaceae bacterium]